MGGKSRLLSFMSMMAEKKVAKKPLFQSTMLFTKNKFYHGINQTERENHLA